MTSPARLRHLCLILTAQCNLRCSYCYQNAKNSRRADWTIIKTALELGFDSHHDALKVNFIGGEPLLEFPMIRRAVEFIGDTLPSGKQVTYSISTNGTRLTEEIAAFLAEHRFETQLSFDGIARAQSFRGADTFTTLDALLDRLRRDQPRFFRWDLAIALAVVPSTIVFLADSVDYFLGKGIRQISISPVITFTPDWRDELVDELDAQFERIYESSLRHHGETGDIPVKIFQGKHEGSPPPSGRSKMCDVVHGESLVVDVDGQAYGCSVFAESYQEIRSQFLRSCLAPLRMGRIDDPEFLKRHARFPEAIRTSGLFHNKNDKYSSYGRCGECPHISQCSVCPASIGHLQGNNDPNRVSDFVCAYNLVSLGYRARFPNQPSPRDLISGPPELHEAARRWGSLAKALRK